MKNRLFSLAFAGVLIIMCVDLIRAQQEDRIIAGDHLNYLWDAINADKVKISNIELKSQILRHQVSALLIPYSKDQRIVRRCFKIKTTFDVPDLEVSKEDYDQLLGFARDGAFEITASIHEAVEKNDTLTLQTATIRLNDYVKSLPAEMQAAERRYTGALLADLEPTQPALASFVKDYRTYIEEKTFRQIVPNNTTLKFVPRRPYVIGGSIFNAADLEKINPVAVQPYFGIRGEEYRKVWVGPNLIFVPQDSRPAPRDRTGLGVTTEWSDCTSVKDCSKPIAFVLPTATPN